MRLKLSQPSLAGVGAGAELGNMENTLKIKVFIKSILFCKYLRNERSDLYEI